MFPALRSDWVSSVGPIAIILGALSDEKMEVLQLVSGNANRFQRSDDLDQKLFEFLTRNGADFEMAETVLKDRGHFGRNRGFRDVQGLVDVK